MVLRSYQREILEAIKNSYNSGTRQQLVHAATGTGKSIIIGHVPKEMKGILDGQTLVIVHREELVDQNIEKLKSINPDLKVSKEMSGFICDVNADIVVASVATLGRKGTKRLDRFDFNNFDKVITDECHRSTAQSYLNIYNALDVLRTDTNKLHIGFTATPSRSDGTPLAKIFQKIVYSYGTRKAIEDGWLCDVKGIRINTSVNLDKVDTLLGDFAQDSLSKTVNTKQRNELIVDSWLKHANDRKTIAFTVDIEHAKALAETFKNHNICAEALWGNDPNRSIKLKKHKLSELQVLTNCAVLIEGYDDPTVNCVLLSKPTKSSTSYVQMVGRGLRTHPSKSDCLVLDVVDNSSKHSLITLPTLMGLNSHLDLRGRSLIKSVHQLELAQEEHTDIDFSELRDITNLKSYVESVDLFNVRFPEEVEENSELSWHKSADGGFVILLPNKIGNVHIRQNMLDKYEISGIINGKRYKGERERIEDAFGAADNLLNTQAADYLRIIRRQEKWHSKPPTMKQMNMLRKIYRGKALPNDLDRGKAAILITRFLSKRIKC